MSGTANPTGSPELHPDVAEAIATHTESVAERLIKAIQREAPETALVALAGAFMGVADAAPHTRATALVALDVTRERLLKLSFADCRNL